MRAKKILPTIFQGSFTVIDIRRYEDQNLNTPRATPQETEQNKFTFAENLQNDNPIGKDDPVGKDDLIGPKKHKLKPNPTKLGA